MFNRSNSIPFDDKNNNNKNPNDYITSINQFESFNYDELRKNICDNIKKLIKCLYDLNMVEKKFLDDLSFSNKNDNDEDPKLFNSELINNWHEMIEKSLKNRQDLAINLNNTIGEPMKRFQIALQEFKSAIKRHEQLMNECNKCKQKLQELKRCDRTSNVIMKQKRYETTLKQSEKDANLLRQLLEKELPYFLEKRIDYFMPSFSSFICSGILFSGLNLDAIDQINFDNNQLDTEQQQLFDEIKNLSIVSF